jgi:hypothetical protein
MLGGGGEVVQGEGAGQAGFVDDDQLAWLETPPSDVGVDLG